MTAKILVPIDDSPTAQQTITLLLKHREQFPPNITLLHVVNQEQFSAWMLPDIQLAMVSDVAEKIGRQALEKATLRLKAEGYDPEVVLEYGSPRTFITDYANEQGFDLVVIGRHEGGGEIRDVLFGSVANYVLHNVKCPVLLF